MTHKIVSNANKIILLIENKIYVFKIPSAHLKVSGKMVYLLVLTQPLLFLFVLFGISISQPINKAVLLANLAEFLAGILSLVLTFLM